MWPAFTNLASGYVDNLRVFRDVFLRKKSYKLRDLAIKFTEERFHDEHEALADAQVLRNLSAFVYNMYVGYHVK